MASMILFLAAGACLCLQFFSRNFFFVFVAAACGISCLSLSLCERTGHGRWCAPSVVLNLTLSLVSLGHHTSYGQHINDYFLSFLLLLLSALLVAWEGILTFRENASR